MVQNTEMQAVKAEYDTLLKEKEEIEEKIRAFAEILDANGHVGMDGKLVDEEGYPRADIDVYSVRHARHDIISLRNDLKAVMSKLEEKLYEIHRVAREGGLVSSQTNTDIADSSYLKPFLHVNELADGGPAWQAGIELGDLIKQFGSVNSTNFQSLKDIGSLVQHSIGKVVRVMLSRDNKDKMVELKPQPWSGRGLLGCNIVPIRIQ